MKPRKQSNKIVNTVRGITRSLSVVAAFLLCVMIVVIVCNIGGRFLFKMPLYGTIELVELMMIIITFFAMAYTSMQRSHVRITVLVEKFPKIVQDIVGRIVSLLSVTIFSLILYQATIEAVYHLHHLDYRTDTLDIPLAPFKIVMVVGIGLLVCIELIHVFSPLSPEPEIGE